MRLLILPLLLCAACAAGPAVQPHPEHHAIRSGAATAEQASRSAAAADPSLVRYATSASEAADPAPASPPEAPPAQPQPVEAAP
jgi:hypothetical protein